MIGDVARRIQELRFLPGIEKAEHVPYPTGNEFWVRFNRSIDMRRLGEVLGRGRYELVKFGSIPSKLPLKLSEPLWNGISYVIVRDIGFIGLLASLFGKEPDGVATIAKDAHSGQPIFITSNEEGMKILYEYLGVKYSPPTAAPPLPTANPPIGRSTQTPAKPVASKSSPAPPPQAIAKQVASRAP